MKIFLIVVGILFAYSFVSALVYRFCEILDIGITHFQTIEDDYSGAIIISVFWPITLPFLITFMIVKYYFMPYINKFGKSLKEKIK